MSGQDDESDKSFDATPQKLIEARRKGEVAKSVDLMTAAGYAGLLAALLLAGKTMIENAGTALMVMLDRSAELAPLFLSGAGTVPAGGMIKDISTSVLPLFLVPAIAVILSVFAQRAWVFAPSKLAPKMSRISLISNAKNKFGRGWIFEFFKSFTKLTVYSICLALFLKVRLPDIVAVLQTNPSIATAYLAQLCVAFLFLVVLISGVIGGIDAVWQHKEHLRKNMMSRKEIMDETKNAEGDPHLKQERRQRAMSISQNQMMGDVPKADVVIVNPTHYAVALQWSRKKGEAPICLAKGVDEIAAAIREAATAAGVPLHSDPPAARALHATTEIGDQIAPEHYSAVAAAIRFAEDMRLRAKARGI